MSKHMFVDENKSSGLLLAAACYSSRSMAEARESLRSFLLPGQERLHFSSERDNRRRQILESIIETVDGIVIVQADLRDSPRWQRQQALAVLIDQARRTGTQRMSLEQDDSVLEFDRKVLYEQSRLGVTAVDFSYGWLRPRQEPLLWAADGLAWAWARGGQWRNLVTEADAVTVLGAP